MRFTLATLFLAACGSSYGDATVDGGSMADSGGGDASSGATDGGSDSGSDGGGEPACTGTDCERIVFVTSTSSNGNRGGLLEADNECQALADASSRTRGRKFRAWLSNSSTSASSRVAHGTKPYRRTDDVVVANDYPSIMTSGLLNPINVDENGVVVATSEVWTGTNEDGSSLSLNCAGWISADPATTGRQGNAGATSAQWTDRGANLPCSDTARIYCFEN